MKKIGRHITFSLFFLGALLACETSMAQKFTASVNKNPVGLNDRFQVTYTINGKGSDFRAPAFENFDVLSGPNTSSSIQIINGNFSQNQSFSFILQPEKEGTFEIAPAKIKVGGDWVKSNSLKVEVVKGQTPQASRQGGRQQQQNRQQQQQPQNGNSEDLGDKVFIKALVSKTNPYEGEQITVTYKLYVRTTVTSYSVDKMPQLNGFWSQDLEIPENLQVQDEVLNGVRYKTAIVRKIALFPQKSGKLEIDPLSLELMVQVQDKNWDPFQDFFGRGFKDVKYIVQSHTVNINVKPLPEAGKPESFDGAVGNYSMKTDLSPKQVTSNEPVTLKATISGSGNIKFLQPFNIELPPSFESYDPKVDEHTRKSGNTISGSKTFEYLMIPRRAGKYKLDPLVFSYFNPNDGKYHELKSDQFLIDVSKGEGEEYASNPLPGKEDVKLIGQDIRFIKTGESNLTKQSENFFLSPGYIGLAIAPILLFGGLFFFHERNRKMQTNVKLVKSKKATSVAKKRLKKARKLYKENNPEAFFTEINNAIWGYFSDRFSIDVSELSQDRIVEKLKAYNAEDELTQKITSIINECDMAKYAPTRAESSMQHILDETEEVISTIEAKIRK